MKTAELIFWCRTKNDRADEASHVGGLKVDQRDALRIAREIENAGAYTDAGGETIHPKGFRMAAHIALGTDPGTASPGHGVIIVYESGRQRIVRADD